jgi:hypothetical protein
LIIDIAFLRLILSSATLSQAGYAIDAFMFRFQLSSFLLFSILLYFTLSCRLSIFLTRHDIIFFD